MGNREKKWNEMKKEYKEHTMSEEQVKKMKETIEKAKKENRKEKKGHVWRNIAAAAASVAVVITVLPNTSAHVAYAMSRIPLLSKWVEVVTFRDYQYEDDRNTANITVPEIVTQLSTEETESTSNTEKNDPQAQEKIKKTAEEINAEIQTITDELIQEFEENLQYEEGYQDMMVKSEVIATTERYFTLKLICYQGAGSGAEWDYFYTIDLENGERLQLADLFTEESDYITPISENIKEQMRAQMKADENVHYWVDETEIPEWNFKEITDETGFYLNEKDEIVICFNEGDVAPMYMGCVEFVIPKEVVADIRK